MADLADVLPEVRRLVMGHRPLGRWTLSQTVDHIAQAVRFTVTGGLTPAGWFARMTVGKLFRRQIIQGRLPEGVKMPPGFPEPRDLPIGEAIPQLEQAIACFDQAATLVEHPLLGKLSRPEWRRFHAGHAAHHLSFILPS